MAVSDDVDAKVRFSSASCEKPSYKASEWDV